MNVYGPVDYVLRNLLWGELEEVRGLLLGQWCIGADFNAVHFVWERRGYRELSSHMDEFSSFIDNNSLMDIPLIGSRFTWTRGSFSSPSMSRIDRFLVCPDWARLYLKELCLLFLYWFPTIGQFFLIVFRWMEGLNLSDLKRCGSKMRFSFLV